MNVPLFLTREEVLAYHAQEALHDAMIRLTTSELDKEAFAYFLRKHQRAAGPA